MLRAPPFLTKLFYCLSLYKEQHMPVFLFFINFHAVAPQSIKFGMTVRDLPAELLHFTKPNFVVVVVVV
jgi:hypothetical protein